jgi:hypothetical protein
MLALLCHASSWTGPLLAQARPQPVLNVKAAYLFNFGRFVRWPDAAMPAGAPFHLCVLGNDPFGPTLDATVAGEKIDGHPVATRRVPSAREATGCHVLFIGGRDIRELPKVLADLGTAPILTVGDMPQFSAGGGMIEFVTVNNKVRFEVNVTAAERAGLALGSELSRVAVAVRRQEPR